MNPISSAELAALRAEVAAAACDQSCIVKRPIKTPDGRLSNTVTLTTIGTISVGMKQPTTGQATLYASLLANQVAWQLKFPSGSNVQAGDHLFIGSDVLIAQVSLTPQSYSTLDTWLAVEHK
jgi:hypothetical protein